MTVEAVRGLVRRLIDVPNDRDAIAVLGDWCEERGFGVVAANVRLGEGPAHARAIFGLQALFGAEGDEESRSSVPEGRSKYTAVLGVPRREVQTAETIEVSIEAYAPMRLRKLTIGPDAGAFVVNSFRIGKWELLYNAEPTIGDVFGVLGPELFARVIAPGQRVRFVVSNVSAVPAELRGCLLGDGYDDSGVAP